jgi:aspartyl-tRNA(Asn)/glutamyl-tRNA(Gln) amidotransferase subunit A
MSELLSQSITSLKDLLDSKQVTAEELAKESIQQIKAHNQKLNAIVHLDEESALEKAAEADKKRASGDQGPLLGLPFSVKDLFNVAGQPTTAGSNVLNGYVAPYTATAIQNLIDNGAVLIGRNNQDEFGMGSRNTYSQYGPSFNPWSTSHSPGGSSGGSASAVSASMSSFSIGSDTGGSVRQPAHFCGVVGAKPTYGRISRYGMIAFASSLDQAGPITKTVTDCALVLQSLCGHDKQDATSAKKEVPLWSKSLSLEMKGKKVGFCHALFTNGVHQETRAQLELALSAFQSAGAEVIDLDLSLIEHAVSVYYLVATSEASSNLARYDGVRYGRRADFSKQMAEDLEDFYSRSRSEGFGAEVERRLIMGTYFLSSGYRSGFYLKAAKVRRLMRDQFLKAFETCDFVLSPVTTGHAPESNGAEASPLEQYLDDQFTVPASLCGFPAMSVPVTRFSNGLPLGLQIIAKPWDEQTMLNAALFIEQQLQQEIGAPSGL